MNVKTAEKKIDKLLWDKYVEKKVLDSRTLTEIKEDLAGLKKELVFLYGIRLADDALIGYPDLRTGFESYGYSSVENIKVDLEYISDRYNCSFRLRWLIDLIDIKEDDIKEKVLTKWSGIRLFFQKMKQK